MIPKNRDGCPPSSASGEPMSGHGKRETRLQADAARWRDRVAIDLTSEYGIVAMKLHHVSIDEIAAAVERIASHIAAGEDQIEMRSHAARFLEVRGHVERMRGGAWSGLLVPEPMSCL